MNRLLLFLETRTASFLCLLIAIGSRIINVLYVSYTGRDKMILVMQSKSFLEGKGFVIPRYFVDQLNHPVYDKTPYWPPGYPLFLSPLLKLFNYNIYNATTAFDILVCIALVLVARNLARQTGLPAAAVNLITLITGVFEYTFISESLPTDTVSLLFLLIAVSCCMRVVTKNPAPFRLLVFCGFLLFLPNFFRYAYPVASMGIPLLIILMGFLLNQKTLIRKGGIVLASVIFSLSVFFLYLKVSAGSTAYALETTRGFFPGNLIHWQPVLPSSFINTAFLSSQLLTRFGIPVSGLLPVLESMNLLAAVLLIGWFYILVRKKYFISPGPFQWFLLMGAVLSLSVILTLGYLSLTYANQVSHQQIWNYIYESRYFAFVTVFTQFVFVALVFTPGLIKKHRLKRLLIFPAAVLFIELGHNLYFNTRVAFSFPSYKSSVYREQDYRYMFDLIRETALKRPSVDILTAGYNDDYFGYIGTYTGHTGIADPITLNDHLPAVKRKTVLYLMLYNADLDRFKSFFEKNQVLLHKQLDESAFYQLEIDP